MGTAREMILLKKPSVRIAFTKFEAGSILKIWKISYWVILKLLKPMPTPSWTWKHGGRSAHGWRCGLCGSEDLDLNSALLLTSCVTSGKIMSHLQTSVSLFCKTRLVWCVRHTQDDKHESTSRFECQLLNSTHKAGLLQRFPGVSMHQNSQNVQT